MKTFQKFIKKHMDIINEHLPYVLESISYINKYYEFRQEMDKPILIPVNKKEKQPSKREKESYEKHRKEFADKYKDKCSEQTLGR